jgi:hypothetical protein
MKVVHVSKPREDEDYVDEFELLLEEDAMSAEEEAFVRGWEEGAY